MWITKRLSTSWIQLFCEPISSFKQNVFTSLYIHYYYKTILESMSVEMFMFVFRTWRKGKRGLWTSWTAIRRSHGRLLTIRCVYEGWSRITWTILIIHETLTVNNYRRVRAVVKTTCTWKHTVQLKYELFIDTVELFIYSDKCHQPLHI